MAFNIVRNKDTFMVEYANGEGVFVAAGDDHFTIDVATADWNLPQPGWDNLSREGITLEQEVPAEFQVGYSKLLGTEGNYSWEHNA